MATSPHLSFAIADAFVSSGAVDAGVDHLAEAVEEAARRLALGLHVGELRLDQLVLGDRLAHRLARLRVLERVVGRALRDAERLRGHAGPGAVEDPHRDPESLTLLAEEVPGGDATAVEGELAGRRAGDAHLRLEPRDLEARARPTRRGRRRCPPWPASGSVFANTV